MDIRSLEPIDFPKVLRIFNSLSAESRALFSWTTASLESQLADSEGLGCWLEGSLASFILFKKLPGACEIQFLATDSSLGRRGLMKVLLQELQRLCQNWGSPIWLEVHAKNQAAFELYKGLGFAPSGLRRRYYPDGGDAVLMGWQYQG